MLTADESSALRPTPRVIAGRSLHLVGTIATVIASPRPRAPPDHTYRRRSYGPSTCCAVVEHAQEWKSPAARHAVRPYRDPRRPEGRPFHPRRRRDLPCCHSRADRRHAAPALHATVVHAGADVPKAVSQLLAGIERQEDWPRAHWRRIRDCLVSDGVGLVKRRLPGVKIACVSPVRMCGRELHRPGLQGE